MPRKPDGDQAMSDAERQRRRRERVRLIDRSQQTLEETRYLVTERKLDLADALVDYTQALIRERELMPEQTDEEFVSWLIDNDLAISNSSVMEALLGCKDANSNDHFQWDEAVNYSQIVTNLITILKKKKS